MTAIPWETLDKATGFFVNITVIAAAVTAIVKLRIFNLIGYRWRSELACKHVDLGAKGTVFTADYTINNTGQRPLYISSASVKLVRAKRDGLLIVPDVDDVIAERVSRAENPALKGLFQIEAGERSIFVLRCHLDTLDDQVFVLCEANMLHRRVPAAYRGFYMRAESEQAAAAAKRGESGAVKSV